MTMTRDEIVEEARGVLQMWLDGYTDGASHGHQHRIVYLGEDPETAHDSYEIQDANRTPVAVFTLELTAKEVPL